MHAPHLPRAFSTPSMQEQIHFFRSRLTPQPLSSSILAELPSLLQTFLPISCLPLAEIVATYVDSNLNDAMMEEEEAQKQRVRYSIEWISHLSNEILSSTDATAITRMKASSSNPALASINLSQFIRGLLYIIEQSTCAPISSSSSSSSIYLTLTLRIISNLISSSLSSSSLTTTLVFLNGRQTLTKFVVERWHNISNREDDAIYLALTILLKLTRYSPSSAPHYLHHQPHQNSLLDNLGEYIISHTQALSERPPSTNENSDTAEIESHDRYYLLVVELMCNMISQDKHAKLFVQSNVNGGSTTTVAAKSASTTTPATASSSSSATSHIATFSLKSLYRSLISLLSSSHPSLVLHSLRFVSHLSVNDTTTLKMEHKLFTKSDENWRNTFQLVGNMVERYLREGMKEEEEKEDDDGATISSSSLHNLTLCYDILYQLLESPTLREKFTSEYSDEFKLFIQQYLKIILIRQSGVIFTTSHLGLQSSLFTFLTHLCRLDVAALKASFRDVLLSREEEEDVHNWLRRDIIQLLLSYTVQLLLSEHENQSKQRIFLLIHTSSSILRFLDQLDCFSHLVSSSSSSLSLSKDTLERLLHSYFTIEALKKMMRYQEEMREEEKRIENALILQTEMNYNSTINYHPPPFSSSSSSSFIVPSSSQAFSSNAPHSFYLLLVRFCTNGMSSGMQFSLFTSKIVDREQIQEMIRYLLSNEYDTDDVYHHKLIFALFHLEIQLESAFLTSSSSSSHGLIDFIATLPLVPLALILGKCLHSTEADTIDDENGETEVVQHAFSFIQFCMNSTKQQQEESSSSSSSLPSSQSSKKSASANPILNNASKLFELTQADSASSSSNAVKKVDPNSIVKVLIRGVREYNLNRKTSSTNNISNTAPLSSLQAQHTLRENDLLQRIATLEQSTLQAKAQHDAQLHDLRSSHAVELREYVSKLAQSERYHISHITNLEYELQAARSTTVTQEKQLREAQIKYDSILKKLKVGGQEYTKCIEYNRVIEQENHKLKEQINTLGSTLTQAQQELAQQVQSHAEYKAHLDQRLNDSYGKLILLNRAYLDVKEEGETRLKNAEEKRATERQHLIQEYNTLSTDFDDVANRLKASENNFSLVHANYTTLLGEWKKLNTEHAQVKKDLTVTLKERNEYSHTLDQVQKHMIKLEAEYTDLQSQYRQVEEKSLRNEAELEKHHQLTAMIHKLSSSSSGGIGVGVGIGEGRGSGLMMKKVST